MHTCEILLFLCIQECQCIEFVSSCVSVFLRGLVFLSDSLKGREENRCLGAFRQRSYVPMIHLPAFTFWYFWFNFSRKTYILFIVTFKDIFYQALFETGENVHNMALPAQM